MEQYNENVAKLRELVRDWDLKEKKCFVIHAYDRQIVNTDVLDSYLNKVENREGETDFDIISLIRFLFLCATTHKKECTRIVESLSKFPFWPINGKLHKDVDKIVFWSENHILMMLSSCYLFKQFKFTELKQTDSDSHAHGDEGRKNPDVPPYEYDLESELLKAYLCAHCDSKFQGVYEVNSHVYLPYSLSALFNIYDYSLNNSMKEHAGIMINNILRHVLLCTPTLTGVANLSATARGFPRTRLRNWAHNINQLINLFNGNVSGDDPGPTAITDFLVTTTWRPNQELFDALTQDQDKRMLKMNHKIDIIRDLYGTISDEEVTPFYWSAGLVLHPKFSRDTKRYQALKRMEHNKHLWPLSYLPSAVFHSMSESYDLLTKGQMYLDINLNVFKRSAQGLCLSSFEWFNPHYAGFQQLPWIANVAGVGIWSQSGCDSKVAGFSITNIHNPCCQQRGSLLLVSYVAPSDLQGFGILPSLFDYRVKLFWPPTVLLDEYRVVNKSVYNASSVVVKNAPAIDIISPQAAPASSSSSSSSSAPEAPVDHSIPAAEELAETSEVPAEIATEEHSKQEEADVSDDEHTEVVDGQESTVAAKEVETHQEPSVPKKETMKKPKRNNSFKFGTLVNGIGKLVNSLVPDSHSRGPQNSTDAVYSENNTWGVLRRKECYVGVLCTRPTRMEKLSHKHGIHQPSKDKSKDLPYYGRQCDARRHSWVIIVGTTAEYSSIDEFIQERLFKVKVSEWAADGSDDYYVEVNDTAKEEVVRYQRIVH